MLKAMEKFLSNLNSGKLDGSSRSTSSPKRPPTLSQGRKAGTPLGTKGRKIELITEDSLSDDGQPNPWVVPQKVRKIEGSSSNNDDRDDIMTDESSNSNFIVDENTSKIVDDRDEISTDPLDESRTPERGDLSSAKSSSSSSSSASFSSSSSYSSSSSLSSSSSSSASLHPFPFLNNLNYTRENNTSNVPTSTVESSWLQAVNSQISSKNTFGQNKVSSSGDPFHELLASSAMSTAISSHSHVNFVPGGIGERFHHIVHQKDVPFPVSVLSEHQPSIQGSLYCVTCRVSSFNQELLSYCENLPSNGELCDVFFQTRGKPIGVGVVVSVNLWREVDLSFVRPVGRKVFLCSKYSILGNSPTASPSLGGPIIPKTLVPQSFVEEPNVPLRRLKSQISSTLAMKCGGADSSDDSLRGTIEKVLYTNSAVFVYLLSLNQTVWELVIDGGGVFTEYKDLLYTSIGQTWSFCNLEVIGTRKVRDDEIPIVSRWKPGCDTIFCRRCRPDVFTGIPIAPGSMLLTLSANTRGSAPDLMPPYVPAPFFTIFDARDYFSQNESGSCSPENKRVSLIGYVYHINKRDAEFWLSDVSNDTGFLCFLRVALRGTLAKQKTSCSLTKGAVVLLRDLELNPVFKMGFADRLTQFEVFKKDAQGYLFSGGVVYRSSSFTPQKLWAGKDSLLEEATLKACEINNGTDQTVCHVPTFSGVATLLSEIGTDVPAINKIIAFSGTVTSVVDESVIGVCSTCGEEMRKYEVPGETPIFTCEYCGSYEVVKTPVVDFMISSTVMLKVIGRKAIAEFKSKCGVPECNEWDGIIGESFRGLTCIFYHRDGDVVEAELLM